MGQVLCRFAGATVRRVIDRAAGAAPEHAHDWPVLSLFVLGGYRNTTELGEKAIAGPSALLYRAGAAHANTIGPAGFEQIEIEFDPRWLGGALPDAPVSAWLGGATGAAARTLAGLCAAAPDEAVMRTAVRGFLGVAGPPAEPPAWVSRVDGRLREDPDLSLRNLARELGRNAAWLGTAYARAAGEGLPATAARLRVEAAARLLRETDEVPASVAAAAGFCDQSHMIRSFRRVLGRLPSAVRAERAFLRAG